MTSESEEANGVLLSLVPERIRERVLFLARCLSLTEISRLPGMPDLRTLYSAIASDQAFKERFLRASNQDHRRRRTALADLVRRSRQADLSRVFVALRKLQAQTRHYLEQNASQYDLRLLSDDELDVLYRILSKAVPTSSEAMFPVDSTKSE